eukprot:TRINITY_DN788_c0_g1_i5.p1 TRINITY_DN788_c0_g1~~TRINITY_DN788_c0_g1_i5.p1  ORF type:complete len:537 (+),score=86.57 TRINITY_DN788_c0_g1_i5:111-1613(+)
MKAVLLSLLLISAVSHFMVSAQMDMGDMQPADEHDEHDEDHHDEHDDDHHEEHEEDHHEEHEDFEVHCECVLDSPVDCSDDAVLNAAVSTLLDNVDLCLNECPMHSVCQNAFWIVHAYHEAPNCPAWNAEAGEAYHDFSVGCVGCIVEMDDAMGRMCEEVDCSDAEDQNNLVAQLTNAPCLTDCATDNACSTAWYRLAAYHEICDELDLSLTLTDQYHDIREVCPAECMAPMSATNMTAECAAELDEIALLQQQGSQEWHTDELPTLDVTAKLDARGKPNALVQVFSEDITLTPNAGDEHVEGEGHLQYYVNGEMVARLYCPHAWVSFPGAGLYNVTVVAHSNELQVYTSSGDILSGYTTVLVPEDMDMDMNMDMDMDMDMDMSSTGMGMSHGTIEWHSDILPEVALEAVPDAKSGYNFFVTLDGFQFAPESASGEHQEGMGHVHFTIDGDMGGMVFCDVFHLDLPAGEHTIGITLNANTHDMYVDANGDPLSAEVTVTF